MAWIRTIDLHEAEGELLAVYKEAAARPLPPAYKTPHGGAAGIRRAHSVDPGLMRVAFAMSGSTHAGDALTWAERELVAASATRVAQCFY
ncbi:MAG: hypothetical protein U0359_15605 [Byssovorax sp.]